MGLKELWEFATLAGMRNVAGLVKLWFRQYQDTLFFVDDCTGSGHIALTIDDGFCCVEEGGKRQVVTDVLNLLKAHNAHATFFLISKNTNDFEEETRLLLEDGHEIGCHCEEDKDYLKESFHDCRGMLDRWEQQIQKILPEGTTTQKAIRWFRAPKGLLTPTMHQVISERKWRHALMDCYCDDWGVNDPQWIADMILKQVKDGSIIDLHMPCKTSYEHTLEALKLVLNMLTEKKVKCLTLTELIENRAQPNGRPSLQLQGRNANCIHASLALPMQCIFCLAFAVCSCICVVLVPICFIICGPIAFAIGCCLWGSGLDFTVWFVLTLSKILSFLLLVIVFILWMFVVKVFNCIFRLCCFGCAEPRHFVEMGVPPLFVFSKYSVSKHGCESRDIIPMQQTLVGR